MGKTKESINRRNFIKKTVTGAVVFATSGMDPWFISVRDDLCVYSFYGISFV
ncbi:MAG: hypothetical protein L3J69_01030 [Desulfobacula sp.]|nr:hypothetical protein [Desulfobacula sp.]